MYVSIEFDFTCAEKHFKNAVDIVNCKLPDNFDASASVEPCPVSDEQKDSLCRRYSVSFLILAVINDLFICFINKNDLFIEHYISYYSASPTHLLFRILVKEISILE